MVIYTRDFRQPLKVGRIVRIRRERRSSWETVKVTRVDENGYFMADLI